jgi:hypothetical protein
VREYLSDDGRVFDGRNDFHVPTATIANRNIDVEYLIVSLSLYALRVQVMAARRRAGVCDTSSEPYKVLQPDCNDFMLAM